MNDLTRLYPTEEVRDDFVPKEVFYKQDFADLEAERLWPYAWQIAVAWKKFPGSAIS